MAIAPLTDDELVKVRELISAGGIVGQIEKLVSDNPKLTLFGCALVSGLIAWLTHGAVNVPPPTAVQSVVTPVVVDHKGLSDEQKKAAQDALNKLKS